ncbi:Pro-Pol polyprotein [Thelohanellus kitauei]|uniref:Pro-Pol polyprotein n=1 Tax=Thelohanellus kitauei TaxID=669202 RepID=A0A0C2MWU4_THEKT|nr:Pro-Pol polyprotein [Thelohanellus kitauei]
MIADSLSRYTANTLSLEHLQELDKEIKDMVLFLKNNSDRRYIDICKDHNLWRNRKRLIIKENVLYFRNRNGLFSIVVPESCREQLIRSYHEIDTAHAGVDKTFSVIRDRYFWPFMYKDIENVVSCCDLCQKFKRENKKHKAPLVPMITLNKFEVWQSDILGPLCQSKRGNRYVILLIDPFTKWVEAFPSPNIDSGTVMNCLKQIISRFGVPKRLHTDQGAQYESNTVQTFCIERGINKTRTSAYHPEGNGLAERAIQTFKQKLKMLCSDNPENWDNMVYQVLLAIRSTPSKSTGFSPAELAYNTSLRTNSDADIMPIDHKAKPISDSQFDQARMNIIKNSKKYKTHYDKSSVSKVFQNGDKVLLKRPVTSGFEQRYDGPFEIIESRPPNYVIETKEGRLLNTHHNRLKLYKETTGEMKQRITNIDDEDDDKETISMETEKGNSPLEAKRIIRIPPENLGYVKKYLPNIFKRQGMSEDRTRTQENRLSQMLKFNGQSERANLIYSDKIDNTDILDSVDNL